MKTYTYLISLNYYFTFNHILHYTAKTESDSGCLVWLVDKLLTIKEFLSGEFRVRRSTVPHSCSKSFQIYLVSINMKTHRHTQPCSTDLQVISLALLEWVGHYWRLWGSLSSGQLWYYRSIDWPKSAAEPHPIRQNECYKPIWQYKTIKLMQNCSHCSMPYTDKATTWSHKGLQGYT